MTTRSDHLFLSSDGALYDTRQKDWAQNPLRQGYRGHASNIRTVADLKATLRDGPFTSFGCYPVFLFTSDGGTLHFKCAEENFRQIVRSITEDFNDGWRVIGCEVNYENPDLHCDHCGERIESAYAEED